MLTLIDPVIDAADLTEPPLRAALALWRGALREGVPPLVDDLDLAAIDRTLLPHLALLSGPDAGGRLCGLFLGSAAAIAVGRDITGRYLDEVYPPALWDHASRFLSTVVASCSPVYEDFVIGPDSGRTVRAARLGLPFLGGDGRVECILLALHYQPSALARSNGVRVMQDRTRLHRQTVRRVRL